MATERLTEAFDEMQIEEQWSHIECPIPHRPIRLPVIEDSSRPATADDAFDSAFTQFSRMTLAFRSPSGGSRQSQFNTEAAQTVPPHLFELVDISSCPSVVFSASEFPTGTLTWIKILVHDFAKPYHEILHLYQGITNTSVHWRAVFEAGKDILISSYKTCNYPLERYYGPSRNAPEFEARKSIWSVKKGVWEAVIEFAQSPLQSSLEAVELFDYAGGLEDAVSEMENSGLFSPWSEVARQDWGSQKIDHTRMLVSPFDPIMHGGLTVADLAEMEDF